MNLKAKKLDVDFDDDFFDSFGGPDPAASSGPTGGVVETTSDANPFAVAAPSAPTKEFHIGGTEDPNHDAFVKSRLKELEGKKAISSEDFIQK